MTTPEPIERVFREEYARVVATLTRRFGDLDVAEEAAAEALVVALERWPVDGVPPNPGAGSPSPPATRRSTASAGKVDATTSTGRQPWKPT